MAKFATPRLLIVSMITFLSACASKPTYLVNVFDIDEEDRNSIYAFMTSTERQLDKYDGKYIERPLLITKEFKNSALPEYTQDFDGNTIVIARFDRKKNLKAYVEDAETKQALEKFKSVSKKQALFSATEFNPMGMLPSKPELGSIEYRPDPAFIMVNGITMKSFFNPQNPLRIKKFIDVNEPKILAAGVKILRPLKKEKQYLGEFNQNILFFTEWPSEEYFDEHHEMEEFVSLAKSARNKAMTNFSESRAEFLDRE